MKHLFILIGLFLIIVGASECNAPKPKAQLTPADQIFYGQERDTGAVTAQALRVVPGTSWIKWGLNDGDSITLNGFALMSQNSVNSQERIVTDTAFREWVSSWVSDSVTITGYPDSSAVYDSLAAHLVLILANSGNITTNGDSITVHRTDIDNNSDSITVHRTAINTLLDSIAAHRTDIDAGGVSTSTLPSNAVFVYILSGQSNMAGFGDNTDASAGELDASTTVQIWNKDTKQFEALNIGAGNNEGRTDQHGIELGISENTPRNIYMIKHARGAQAITQWLPPTSPELDTLVNYQIKPAINKLIEQGKVPYMIFMWHQGENDADSEAEVYAYMDQLTSLRDTLNTLLGGNVPFIAGEINENNTLDISLNDRFRYLDGENFFKFADLDWQVAYRADASHLNYNGLKAASQVYMNMADTLYPGLLIDNYIGTRKDIDILSVDVGECSSDVFSIDVGVQYWNLDDSIIINVYGQDYAYWKTDFYGSDTLTISNLTCDDSTGVPVYAYIKNALALSDRSTFNSPASSTISIDFASGYTPPTTDNNIFTDRPGGGHEIAIVNSDTMVHLQEGDVASDNPGFFLDTVPTTTTDITMEFTMYVSAATGAKGIVYLRADTAGVTYTEGHLILIRADGGTYSIFDSNGEGTLNSLTTESLPQGGFSDGEERKYRASEIGNLFTLEEWNGSSWVEVDTYTHTTSIRAQGGVGFGAIDLAGNFEQNVYFDDLIIQF